MTALTTKQREEKTKEYADFFRAKGFKIESEYEHGFGVRVNDLQTIFIRPYAMARKGKIKWRYAE